MVGTGHIKYVFAYPETFSPNSLASHITFLLSTYCVVGTILSAKLRLKSINLATYIQELQEHSTFEIIY